VSDNLLGYTPSPDAIEEFNMISNNAPAEFGNFMGGIVSATLKSGTNAYHGDIWEFFRNDKLNANQWENKINPSSPAILGAAALEHVWGNPRWTGNQEQAFFFVDYQGQRFDHRPQAASYRYIHRRNRAATLALCVSPVSFPEFVRIRQRSPCRTVPSRL